MTKSYCSTVSIYMYFWARVRDFIETRALRIPPLDASTCRKITAELMGINQKKTVAVTEGWNNLVLHVQHKVAFRFPRSHLQAGYLRAEQKFLSEFAQTTSLPIPRPILHRRAGLRFPFMRYEYVQGAPLTHEKFKAMPPTAQVIVARQLGEFLTSLHAFPVRRAQVLGIPHDNIRALETSEMKKAKKFIFPLLSQKEQEWITRIFTAWKSFTRGRVLPSCVVHADLKEEHILFNEDKGVISGVIDFGDVHIDDPAVDFASLVQYRGNCAENALKAYKRPVDESFRRRMDFYVQREKIFVLTYFVIRKQTRHVKEALKKLKDYITTHEPWGTSEK